LAAPIAHHALLSDCRTGALVDSEGTLVWWPGPRFDAPSAFSALLDDGAGHWSIRPAGRFEAERRYLPGTLVLETTMRTTGGVLRLLDALALEPGARGHEIGLESPHAALRVAECTSGELTLDVEYVPRLEYGLAVPRFVEDDGALATLGGAERLFLRGDHRLEIDGAGARGRIALRAGEGAAWILQRAAGTRAQAPSRHDPERLLEETIAAWRSWAEQHGGYDGPHGALVRHSSIVLQGLTYQPTGAIVAAATTSLPEAMGGERNYDYRYGWLRDAALIARALRCTMCADESRRFFEWIVRVGGVCRDDDHVPVVFGVEGERDLTERTLDHLGGYRGSRPVRVGNAAWKQRQLDVLGEVVDCAWELRDDIEFDPFTVEFLCRSANRAAQNWRKPDASIWEERGEEQHHLVSKLMCWVALDRGVRLVDRLGEHADPRGWSAERDAVRRVILEEGFNEDLGAFTGVLGSDRLDAGVLLIGRAGLLPHDDPRLTATIETIEDRLVEDDLVHRWEDHEEGAFLPASFWLAECHARAGRRERAEELFARASAQANDVGLLAEQADPATGEALGNLPQALSHVALVNAAEALR
jgi:GH15 family glucan-1,4-alpha-glucosidase